MIVSALIASTKALKDAIMLSLLGFSMFSLLGNQLFQGSLRQKCVYKPPWVLIGEEQLQNCSIIFLQSVPNSFVNKCGISFNKPFRWQLTLIYCIKCIQLAGSAFDTLVLYLCNKIIAKSYVQIILSK